MRFRKKDLLGFDPVFIKAVILTESSGEPYATRFEPKWRYSWNVDLFSKSLAITSQTEGTHQATSWGLMQVMGTVAREHGFRGHLPALCNPSLGVYYGLRQLQRMVDRYGKFLTPERLYSAYNSGTTTGADDRTIERFNAILERCRQEPQPLLGLLSSGEEISPSYDLRTHQGEELWKRFAAPELVSIDWLLKQK